MLLETADYRLEVHGDRLFLGRARITLPRNHYHWVRVDAVQEERTMAQDSEQEIVELTNEYRLANVQCPKSGNATLTLQRYVIQRDKDGTLSSDWIDIPTVDVERIAE